MIASGVHKLNEFGVLATIHQLSGRDPLKHAAIEAIPYYKIYEILKLEKTEKDIHEAYKKIMETKAKNKNILEASLCKVPMALSMIRHTMTQKIDKRSRLESQNWHDTCLYNKCEKLIFDTKN